MYPRDTIHIFDAGRDRFVKIEYKDALKRNLAAYEGDPESGAHLDLSGLYQKIKRLADEVGENTRTNLDLNDLKQMLGGTRSQTVIDQWAGKQGVTGGTAVATPDDANGAKIKELLDAFPTLLLLRPFQTWRMAR